MGGGGFFDNFNPLNLIATAIDAREKGIDRDFNRDEADKAWERESAFTREENRLSREQAKEFWLGDQSYNTIEAQKAREYATKEAATARDFEERMSNTSYQRAMADLKAAGLNPMLAYMQGGASTPNASSPQIASTSSHGTAAGHQGSPSVKAEFGGRNISEGLMRMVSTAIEGKRLKKDIEETKSRINLNAAAKEKELAEADRIRKEIPGVEAESNYKKKLKEFEGKPGILEGSVILDKVSGPLVSGAMGYLLRGKGLEQGGRKRPLFSDGEWNYYKRKR